MAGRSDSQLRRLLTVVFLIGGVHAGLYAVSFPPWAIEDEQQHVDYVWKLAFDQRIPDIEDPVDQSIIEAAAGTDRWNDYGLQSPNAFVPEAMGLEGRSYQAYHPPLAYAILVPLARATGERALVLMYILRGVNAAVAGAVSVMTVLLALNWCRGPRRRRMAVAGAAGLAVALLPAVADSGGRVNTDSFAALFVVGGVLLLDRWLDRPTRARAWAVGGVLAAAVLSRETTVVLAVPVAINGIVAFRRGQLSAGDTARALAPPALALTAWLAHIQRSTGYLDPSDAFRDRFGAPHPYPGSGDFLHDLAERAVLPYADSWPLPNAVSVGLGVVIGIGLVLAVRSVTGVQVATALGALVLSLAILFQQAREGTVTPTARLLLPAYPLLLGAATVGWANVRGRGAAAVVPAAVVVIGVWFLVGSFMPKYAPGLG
jgi:4-amino-4-deoxy-L-arabinose transferase-like glycosyltransferase